MLGVGLGEIGLSALVAAMGWVWFHYGPEYNRWVGRTFLRRRPTGSPPHSGDRVFRWCGAIFCGLWALVVGVTGIVQVIRSF